VPSIDKADLVGITEICSFTQKSSQRIVYHSRTAAFPDPLIELAMGRIWLRGDIERWARTMGWWHNGAETD
jgi:hypothetical protein